MPILLEARTIARLMHADLPPPSPEAQAHGEALSAHLRGEIRTAGGWIPFSRYMELALYAPGLGYYTAGSRKLGAAGDFVTAPELTPLFGQCIAACAQQVMQHSAPEILEVGAGSGVLAAALLQELEARDALPERYLILELSPDLRERERDTLAARVPHLLARVAWLNRLPPAFSGLVLGNEVLDAMPVEVVHIDANGAVEQGGVDESLAWAFKPAEAMLRDEAQRLGLPPGYRTEVGLVARGFIASVAQMLERGAALFIDYGFPQREFYHPQRGAGTLMCHYRHRAHDDPFFLPGLQDITAHVDFSAIAETARAHGLDVLGYTTQAQFLIDCGVTELLLRTSPEDTVRYLTATAAAQKLLSPAEMGELFKAILLTRGLDGPVTGFRQGDKHHTL